MNKVFPLLIVSLLSCNSYTGSTGTVNNTFQKQSSMIEKAELEEVTRGSRRMAEFSASYNKTEINGTATQNKMSTDNWENLNKTVSAIDLNKLNTYPAPTTERFHDGALIAIIKITSKNGTVYESQSFDSGRPPKELAALYKILSAGFK